MDSANTPIPEIEDEDGFLREISSWSRSVAEELARKNNIGPLTEDHWRIIEFVQTYYKETHHGPSILKVAQHTGFTSKRICELFECGIARGAYRLAGLPRPSGCL